jgi:hypothetical protein
VKWKLFTKNENGNNEDDEDDETFADEFEDMELGFAFVENKNSEIDKLIATEMENKGVVTNIVMDNNDWINADDI